jgi:DNA repair exonuclease SbcCD ATPase subunit
MQYTAQDDRTSVIGHLSNGVLASLQQLIACNNADADATQARLQALEQAPWRSEKMRALDASGMLPCPSAPAKTSAEELAEARAQIKLLEQKLAAANAELLRCRTQLYAYEREIRALLEESTALEAELESAQERGLVPSAPQAPDPLLDLEDPAQDDSDADVPPREPKSPPALYIAEEEPSSSSTLPRAAAVGAPIRSLNV